VGTPHRASLPARPLCGGDAACPGSCDGTITTKCVYPANRCRTRSCSATTSEVINEASCNASGVCPPVTTTSCQFACQSGACTACLPGTRQCGGPTTPQLCDNNGTWQNQTCVAIGNKVPVCTPDGNCVQQCQPGAGGTMPQLTCASGNVCGVWAFETGTTEGWMGASTPAWNGTLNAIKGATVPAGNSSWVLAAGFNFTAAKPELIILLRLCTSGTTSLSGRSFSFDTYVGAGTTDYFSVGPRSWNNASFDTPNGVSLSGGKWVNDAEGFSQTGAVEMQIVLRYNVPYPLAGTAYFDNFRFN
jgi:hypothetical protein